MSKRTRVPRLVLTPGLRAAVIAAYEEGQHVRAIARNFGISAGSVGNIVSEVGLRRAREWHRLTAEQVPEVAARYLAGEESKDLGREFGVTAMTVRRAVQRSGAETRHQRQQRPLRHDAFDVLTPEAAYWLGIMFTDGFVNRRPSGQDAIGLGLQERDHGHLVKFRDFLGSDHAIVWKPPKRSLGGMGGVQYMYWVRSQPLADRLDALGRYGPAVHPDLAVSRDFWRGCIDGDGCLNIAGNYPGLKLSGSDWLLGAFVEFLDSVGLRRTYGHKPVNVRPSHSIFVVGTAGLTAVRITELLYSDAMVALDRKVITATKIMSLQPPYWVPKKRGQR